MALYESELTQFMNEWLKKHPEELKVRQEGRALWWDKPQTLEQQQEFDKANIPQKPYVYQSE